MPATIQEKCDRLATIKGEMEGILLSAKDRSLTDDEAGRFDALDKESDVLKPEIASYKADKLRRAKLGELDTFIASTPVPGGPSRDNPLGDLSLSKPARRYQGKLRGFDNAEDAYQAGMHLLSSMHHATRDGLGSLGQWADKYCRDQGLALLSAVQSEGDNTRGGFLVSTPMENAIVKLREMYGVARKKFAPKVMTSSTLTWPREEGNHTVYYPEEGGEITASAMKWGNCSILAKKMAALAKMSRELNDDAVVNMADEIANSMAWKFAYAEDLNGFIGDGTAAYGGMTGIVPKLNSGSYAGSIYTAIAGNTSFGAIDLADFEAMVGMLPLYAEAGAEWYISKVGWAASMMRLINAAGGNTGDMIAGKVPKYFMGYPVQLVNVMNSTLTAQTSTKGLCLLGDLSRCCYLGDRQSITVDVSTERYFENDQIGIKAVQRVGITCTPGDPVNPATAAGPVISLNTPGS
jgi:HK97 family phage major capsid protein